MPGVHEPRLPFHHVERGLARGPAEGADRRRHVHGLHRLRPDLHHRGDGAGPGLEPEAMMQEGGSILLIGVGGQGVVLASAIVAVPGREPHALMPYVVFFNDTATTEIYTLSLHDALPISPSAPRSAPSPRW